MYRSAHWWILTLDSKNLSSIYQLSLLPLIVCPNFKRVRKEVLKYLHAAEFM